MLAGGFGTRLRPVVHDVPKPMAPVAGRPFLEIVLSRLARNGVRRVVLSIGHMAETIVAHFGNHFAGMDLVYEVEDQPRGTGGATACAMRHVKERKALVLNGDTYLEFEVAALDQAWVGVPIIVARHVDDTSRYGRLEVEGTRVVGLAEKGIVGPGLINAGAYVLPFDFFAIRLPPVPFSLETDILSAEISRRRVDVFISKGLFIDIGIPDDYQRAQGMGLGTRA